MTQVATPTAVNQNAVDHLNQEDAHLAQRAKELDAKRAAENSQPAAAPETTPAASTTPPAETPPAATTNTATPPATPEPAKQPGAEKIDGEIPAATATPEITDDQIAAALNLEERAQPNPETDTDQNAEVDTDLAPYKQKAQELDDLLSDPLTKAIVEARKSGKPINEILKEIQGEDYSKLSAKDLFELDLNNYNLDEDGKAIEREKFNGMLVSTQNEIANKIKQGLEQKRIAGLEQYKVNMQQRQLELEQAQARGHQRLSELKEKKVYNNLEITPERFAKIQEYVEVNARRGANGEYDIDLAYRHAIYDLYEKEVHIATTRKALTDGKLEIFKNVTRPDMGTSTPSTLPAVSEDKKEEAAKASAAWRKTQSEEFNPKF